MTFDPTKKYYLVHVVDGEITYHERLLSEAITLITNYLNMSREESVRHILERYNTIDINSAVLQMITYMYTDVASTLEDIEDTLD